jgi:hypothetical protein
MKLEISDDNAMDLAYFCKRVTYDDALKRAHGETLKEQVDMAYRILKALGEVGGSLSAAGYSPR